MTATAYLWWFWLLLPISGWAFTPEEQMVLEVEADGYRFPDGIDAYYHNEQIYLPLADLVVLLDLAITVETHRAMGWFIDSQRDFVLLHQGEGRWRLWLLGDEITLRPEEIILHDEQIYVTARSLAWWWPLNFELNFADMLLNIHTDEPFPFKRRLQRQGQQLQSQGGPTAIRYPLYETPYRGFVLPAVDMNLYYAINRRHTGDREQRTNYSLLSHGDLAWMSGQIYLGGVRGGGISSARIKLERADYNAGLLGPLQATQIEVGDIAAVGLPLLTRTTGRGVLVGNEPLVSSNYFDQMVLRGDYHPGWEVELYHNGILIGYSKVDETGTYQFDDLNLYYGDNQITLNFYGPGGERRSKNQLVQVGAGSARSGEFIYRLAVSEPGRSMFEIDSTPALNQRQGSFSFGYGIAHRLQLNGGAQLSDREDEKRYGSLGFQANIANSALRVDATQNREGEINRGYLLQIPNRYFGLRLGLKDYSGFAVSSELEPLLQHYTVGVLSRLTHLSVALEGERDHYPTRVNRRFNLIMAGRNGRLGWSHSLTYTQHQATSVTKTGIAGGVMFSYSTRALTSRLNMGYRLGSETDLREVTASSFLRDYFRDLSLATVLTLDNETSMTLDIDYYPNSGAHRYATGLSWLLPYMRITPTMAYTSSGDYMGYINVAATLNRRQRHGEDYYVLSGLTRSSTGTVQALLFEDQNLDGRYERGEPLLPGGVLVAEQHRRQARSNTEGEVVLDRLRPWQPTDIVLMEESLADPALVPVYTPISIVPRPGHLTYLEIPYRRSGEIEGVIYRRDQAGVDRPIVNQEVMLVNEVDERVAGQRSGIDGSFLFERIYPGRYQMRVGDQFRSGWIEISVEGDVIRGQDIILLPAK